MGLLPALMISCKSPVPLNLFILGLQVTEHKAKWCSQHFLNIRSLRKAVEIYKQLEEHVRGLDAASSTAPGGAANAAGDSSGEGLRRALTAGLFMNAATRQPDGEQPLLV